MFDLFGFVEDFPQSWKFSMKITEDGREVWDDLKFCLTKDSEDGPLRVMSGDNYSDDPEDEKPLEGNIKWLGEQLEQLKEVESSMKEDATFMLIMPTYEWEMA